MSSNAPTPRSIARSREDATASSARTTRNRPLEPYLKITRSARLWDRALLERVEITVGAAEIDDAVDDERRGHDRSDSKLTRGRHDRRFAPARCVEQREVEP